jgi:hypothetical protein
VHKRPYATRAHLASVTLQLNGKPPSSLGRVNLTYHQAFEVGDVKPLEPNTDFSKVTTNDVAWVKGKDKRVQWKGSTVTVFEKDSKGKSKSTPLASHDGSLQVTTGVDLYIAGGQYIEE